MSKKIRVAWEDLQPGDLIHVKGSTNVYQFIRFTENKRQAEVGTSGVCAGWGGRKVLDNEGKVRYWFETGPTAMLVVSFLDFAYATRPAPKRPRLEEPQQDGEYWLKVDYPNRKWLKLIVFRGGSIWFFVIGDLGPNVFTPYPTWVDVLRNINPLEVLSAEGYYMRKAKGKL